MKLTTKYLGIGFQEQPALGRFYFEDHCNLKMKPVVEADKAKAEEMLKAGFPVYFDKSIGDWWEERVKTAKRVMIPAKKIYYITHSVQDLVKRSVKMDKIELKWFAQLGDLDAMYITGKDEFYRFVKEGHRINVLYYSLIGAYCSYESYSIIVSDGVLAVTHQLHKEWAEFFCKLLLFMEMGETTYRVVKPSEKLKYGKGGEDNVKNESGTEVIVVTSDWNTRVIVEGEFAVSGHIRIQAVGIGRSRYEMVWVHDYTKNKYVKRPSSELN